MEGSRKKTKPSQVTLEHGKSGGHIVTHSFDNSMNGSSYQPSERHVVANDAAMQAHLKAHYFSQPTAANDDGATADAGANPKVSTSPDQEARPTGLAGRAKAKPPTARSAGAGMD